MLAGMLFPPRQQRQDHGKLDDLRVSGSQYGAFIPQCYGLGRVAGSLVWVEKDANGNHLRESSRPIRASKGGSRTVGRKYTYTVTMAWLICKGPIAQVKRIWGNDKVLYDAALGDPDGKYTIRIYLGTEDQEVDEAIEAAEGEDQWTGYRGMAYAVLEDFPLGEFGNAIPNMSFEVAGIGGTVDYTPLVHYAFEDDPGLLIDSGPNGYDLTETQVGLATQTTGPTGHGEALRFAAATDQYLRRVVGNLPDWQGAELTVDLWCRYRGAGTDDVTFQYWDPAASSNYSFQLLLTAILGGGVQVSIAPTAGTELLFDESLPLDSDWHRITWTYDGLGTSKLYLDTVEVGSISAPHATLAWSPTATAKLEIFEGDFDLDEVTVYNAVVPPSDDEGAAAVTVDVILAHQFAQVGLTAGEYNVTAAAAKSVTGFVLGSRVDVRQADRELLMLTDLDLAEVDGKIVVVARGGASVATIAEGELGAYVADSTPEAAEPPALIEAKRLPGSELPYRLDLEYLSRVLDYQQGQATATRFARVAETQEQLTVSTPLVLTEAQARQAAEKLLYQQWWERQQLVVTVGPKFLFLAPGDIVTVPVAGSTLRARVEQADVDPFGVIRLTLAQDAAEILTQVLEGPTLEAPFAGLTEADETLMVAWVGNALLDSHAVAGDIGVYVAAGGPLEEDWPGATLFWSRDGGVTYAELGSLEDNATLGSADTVLAAPASYDLWDDVSTVDVEITSGDAPETSSDTAVLNGANAAILGEEVIQFVTVTALGSNVYRLSRLLRGRRGTESYGGSHLVGDRFALLEDGRVKRFPVDFALLGKTVHLKAVTVGTTVAVATAVSIDVLGTELKPYAVAHVTGSRDGSNNLTISFERRARAGGAWADLVDVQQPESTLAFELDVLTAPGGSVVRTITTSTESASYLASEQVTDFGSAQNPVHLAIYQRGAVGRGYVKTASV
jgi:hypothetical protein